MPATPVRMSIHPTTWRLRNEGLVVTAKARIAPIAISASPVAVLIVLSLPPQGDSLHPLVNSFLPERPWWRDDGAADGRPRSEPAPARFREPGQFVLPGSRDRPRGADDPRSP